MNDASNKRAGKSFDGRPSLTPGKAASLLWDCAWEALVLAFLVQIMGTVAFAMIGNVFSRMTPSLPPGLAGESRGEPAASAAFHFTRGDRFSLIFAVVFTGLAVGRLIKHSGSPQYQSAGAWLDRMTRRVSEEWFQVVVMNAFIASIMVPVLQITGQFTPIKMLWNFLVTLLHPFIQTMTNLLPEGPVATAKGWLNWYAANQLKFNFWLLYSAAICDDLGLPNYKALGRWLWRRCTRNKQTVAAVSAQPSPK